MYSIGQVSQKTHVSTQTIRYYERITLLPKPKRATNGYRRYNDDDVERLQFITRARQLDFTLYDIREILALRERQEAPCEYVMSLMHQQMEVIQKRIRDLQELYHEIDQLHDRGLTMPEDVEMKACICHVIQTSEQGEAIRSE